MRKCFPIVAGLCFSVGSLCAQSTTPVAGGSAKNNQSGSMSYTVGQVDYLYSHSSEGNAVAGVQQPFDENLAFHSSCDGVELTLYPNPTVADFYVISDALDVKYPYILSDMTGKILQEGTLDGEYTTIPMSGIVSGTFLLKISCGDGKDDYSVFKVVKN